MTQTNNERDALLKTQDFIERIIEHTTDDWAKTELREVFNFIELSLEKKPISQNEQQEVVGYIDEFGNFENSVKQWMIDEPDVKWKPLYTSPHKQMPDGWKLVPIEPTSDQINCAADVMKVQWQDSRSLQSKALDIYKAMLNASPTNTEVGE